VLRTSFIGFALGVLITIPLGWIIIVAAGAGHGSYVPAKLIFPVGMLGPVFRQSLTPPWVIAVVLQFPIYGLLIGRAYHSRRVRLTALCVAAFHFLVAAVSFVCDHGAFS
jgi:hypothetical protein